MTNDLFQQLDAMTDEELYEVSDYCARVRAKRRREEKREEAREKRREEELPITRARTRGIFQPPTVDEVRKYCEERQNKIDPERFCSYYASKGWIVGKVKMKDWRAAIRTWERNDRDRPNVNSFRRVGGWTPPAINKNATDAQLAEIRKAGL